MKLSKILVPALVLSVGATSAWAYMKFGYDGRDGRNGYDGQSGYDGLSQVVMATGQPQTIDLSGRSGTNGYDGEDGQDASGCFFSQGPSDVYGADGGNAGRGGLGGRGGNTGLLTAYYADPASLSAVQVRAIPGTAGLSGRSGRPGRGCDCRIYSWTVTQNGQSHTYRCQAGRDGMSAYNVGMSTSGIQQGTLLIPQLAPIPPESPKLSVAFGDLLNGPFELSKNQWTAVTGVRAMFAPGSYMSDSGARYDGLLKLRYAFQWQAARPMAEFAASQMALNLPKKKIDMSFPADVWLDGSEAVSGDLTTYTVTSALYDKDAANLSFAGAAGSGTALRVSLADGSSASDLVTTSVSLRYSTTSGAFGYQSRYSGVVPASAMTIAPNNISIAVGALGIMPTYLRPGTYAMVEMTITRRLGSRSKSIVVNKTFRI